MAESEIKIFRIQGKYVKKHQRFTFKKYVRAIKESAALEKVLSEITSIRIFRRKVEITDITVVKPEECENQYMVSLANMQ